jgi:hypothetical protein
MTTREDTRMKKAHKLVAILLVAVVTTLLVGTMAYADAGDAAEEWSGWVCDYLGVCEP